MKRTIHLFNRTLGLTSAAVLAFTGAAWADHHEKDEATSRPASESTAQSTRSSALPATGSQTASSTDQHAAKFLREAKADNEMEIAMGKLGMERAQNSELKKFAEHLQRDHTKAKTKLTSLAQQHGVSADQDKKEHKELTRLEKLNGAEFDREFTLAALKAHQKDITKYKQAVQKVQAAEVRQFAQQTLPILQQHLSQAAQVAQTIGIDQSTISAYTRPGTSAVGGSTETGESSEDSNTSAGSDESTEKNHQGHGASQLKQGGESSSDK
jgi:putative membrane protein